jgi:hypothetical protein
MKKRKNVAVLDITPAENIPNRRQTPLADESSEGNKKLNRRLPSPGSLKKSLSPSKSGKPSRGADEEME